MNLPHMGSFSLHGQAPWAVPEDAHLSRASKRREKQEREAAALRASSSRRKSQAFALGAPAAWRTAGGSVRAASTAAVGHRSAAGGLSPAAQAVKQLTSSPGAQLRRALDAKQRGGSAAHPAQPCREDLDPVHGTKRLCKRRNSEAAAALARIAEMPASLADSTQGPSPHRQSESALPAWLGGNKPAAQRPESPLPAWLGDGGAPANATREPVQMSVSPMWLMESEEALPRERSRAGAQQPASVGAAIEGVTVDGNLADPPSLAEDMAPSAAGGGASVGAGKAQPRAWLSFDLGGVDGASDAAASDWRLRHRDLQLCKPEPAAALHREGYPSQQAYHDTYRCADVRISCAELLGLPNAAISAVSQFSCQCFQPSSCSACEGCCPQSGLCPVCTLNITMREAGQ